MKDLKTIKATPSDNQILGTSQFLMILGCRYRGLALAPAVARLDEAKVLPKVELHAHLSGSITQKKLRLVPLGWTSVVVRSWKSIALIPEVSS